MLGFECIFMLKMFILNAGTKYFYTVVLLLVLE